VIIGVKIKMKKGESHSKEAKLKISLNNGLGMKGKKHSKNAKRKMSLNSKGCVAWNKGLTKKDDSRIIAPKGKNHYRWIGGVIIHRGYKCIRKPNHPFAAQNGYVRENRLVMEKKLGRFLKPKEVVHHINDNKLDNNIKNLKLFNNANEHTKFHNEQRRIIKCV